MEGRASIGLSTLLMDGAHRALATCLPWGCAPVQHSLLGRRPDRQTDRELGIHAWDHRAALSGCLGCPAADPHYCKSWEILLSRGQSKQCSTELFS